MRDKFSELAIQVREFAKKTERPFYVCMFNDEQLCCSGSNISGNEIVAGCVAALYENLKDNNNQPSSIMKKIIISALSGKNCRDGGFSSEEFEDLYKLIDEYAEEK